ncbi:hypothetical protein D6779_06370 [Candidatus Parcubacteria bacterium]|nr:MAG: hypothetical protein D6779_06370 [Candidatus Parcubacteria bacterium]
MGKKRVSVGDVFEIPLSDGRKAYGQYVFRDEKEGPLIQVFDLITEGKVQPEQVLERLKMAKPLFPPVITGVFAAVRTGLWKVIGRLPVQEFTYPKFVAAFWDEKTGKAKKWFLYDGKKDIPVGPSLPEEYKRLEFLVVWSPYDVMHRIETGEYPYPYGDLIRYNKFTPRDK